MNRSLQVATLVTIGLLSLILVDVTPYLRGPAPYPPEWRWELRESRSLVGFGRIAVIALGLAAVYGASLARFARSRPRVIALSLLPVVVALAAAFQLSLLATPDSGAIDALVQRTASPTFTSYHTVATQLEPHQRSDFLERYPELLERFPVHARTHPPGPILFFAAWRGALAGGLAVVVLGSLTCAALFLLARSLGSGPLESLRLGVAWAVVPAFGLMVPQFDAVVALTTTLFAALLVSALHHEHRGSRLALAALAGLVSGLGFHLSYGAAVFAIVALVFVFAGSRPAVDVLGVAGGVALAAIFLPLRGYDPIASARAALEIHAAEFTAPRSYATWLVFNPWDLAVFVGFPVAVLFVDRVRRAFRERSTLVLAMAAALVVLVVSGTVRGEAGRIWLPIMPFLVIVTMRPLGAREQGVVALLLLACTMVLRFAWQVP